MIDASVVYSGNFNVQIARPLDARQKCLLKADLTDPEKWKAADGNTYLWKGMNVFVDEDGQWYYLSTDPKETYTTGSGSLAVTKFSYQNAKNWKTVAIETDPEFNGIRYDKTNDSVAEGAYGDTLSGAIATGNKSHAEGKNTKAIGNYSHAEGETNTASGARSHVEGYINHAHGENSHVEGSCNDSYGESQHIEGMYNTGATGAIAQHVGGIYNNPDTNALFIIGNGRNNARSNAMVVGRTGMMQIGSIQAMKESDRASDKYFATDGTIRQLSAIQGQQGATGLQGVTGERGPQGAKGNDGSQGATGLQGVTGERGVTGLRGATGTVAGVSSSGTGNAVTSMSVSNGILTYSKGNSFLPLSGGTITGSVTATQGFFDTSDARKKKIKCELSLDKCLEAIEKCETIIYTLLDDDKEQIGIIAQEIEEIFPEVVETSPDGYKSVNYSRLSVICMRTLRYLIEEVKIIKENLKQ